jgi:PAS domain-containing protein
MIDRAVREAQQEFRALEFYNQNILQNISLGIVVVSGDNTIITWNAGAGQKTAVSSTCGSS